MNRSLKNTVDENIYIYWGLPFGNIRRPMSGRSRLTVLGELMFGLDRWVAHLRGLPVSTSEVRKNTEEVVSFIRSEIVGNYKPSDLKALMGQAAFEKMKEAAQQAAARRKPPASPDNLERGVIDLGTEIRKK